MAFRQCLLTLALVAKLVDCVDLSEIVARLALASDPERLALIDDLGLQTPLSCGCNQPCGQGDYFETADGYECHCTAGYLGIHCTEASPCNVTGYTGTPGACVCADGYTACGWSGLGWELAQLIPSHCAGSDPTAPHWSIDAPGGCDNTVAFGSCTSFTCASGYEGGAATCTVGANWATVDCTPNACTTLPSFYAAGLGTTCNTGFNTDSTCSLSSCATGYTYMSGSHDFTCVGGVLGLDVAGNSDLDCEVNMCAEITIVASGTTAGTVATCTEAEALTVPQCVFKCASGYQLSGASNPITCNIDGVWPTYPTCVGDGKGKGQGNRNLLEVSGHASSAGIARPFLLVAALAVFFLCESERR